MQLSSCQLVAARESIEVSPGNGRAGAYAFKQYLATPDRYSGGSPTTSPLSSVFDAVRDRRKTHQRILIADDHEAVRRGLRSALVGAGWQVCGEAVNGQEAIQKTMELKPDLVILDVSMPNVGGLEAAREILKSSQSKVLIFTMHESKQIRDETANIGVHGMAVKSAPLSVLLATIDSIFTT
jgi:CheY-like chemotaxis protein